MVIVWIFLTVTLFSLLARPKNVPRWIVLLLCIYSLAISRYLNDIFLKDFASGLAPLGTPQSFVQASQGLRGGMTLRVYIIRFPQKVLRAWTYEMPDGKLEQYQIAPQN